MIVIHLIFAITSFVLQIFSLALFIRVLLELYFTLSKTDTTNPLMTFLRMLTQLPCAILRNKFPKLMWTSPETGVTWDFAPAALLVSLWIVSALLTRLSALFYFNS